MTPEEQRIAIAMACGMVVVSCTCCANPWKNLSTGKHIPDYLNDLNAMHEAVMSMDDDNRKAFRRELQYLIAPQTRPGPVSGIKLMSMDSYDQWFHATAAQRAEAFLKTLNLWKDQ